MKNVIAHSFFESTLSGEEKRRPSMKIFTCKSRRPPGLRVAFFPLISLLMLGPNASAGEARSSDGAAVPGPPECLKYDRYNHKGSESPFPSNCESISPELGGLRKSMYDRGWNAQAIFSNGVTYDLRNHDHGPQIYSGQKPSYTTTGSLLLTHDLERHGLPKGSLITLGGSFAYSSFRGDGIREAFISQLSARIPLKDDRLIIQVGYFSLASQFYGTLLGNNIAASTLGPSSGLLAQVGALGFKPSPAFDIRFYSKDKRYYNHFGVARSISPEGLFPDSEENVSGLKFNTKDARPIFIDEVGYRVEAGPDQKKVWLRAGVIYNKSEYTRLDTSAKKSPNHGAYIVGDLQLTQPDLKLPYKGWYMNAYVNQGRGNVNYLPGAFGGSLYSLAPLESRPYDLAAFGFSKNKYSRWARSNATAAGQDSAKASTNFSISYAYRMGRGAYLQSALIYTDNPTFSPRRAGALNLNMTAILVF